MNYTDRTERLVYLLELIEKNPQLCANDFALKLQCSKRTILRMIEELRVIGHPIRYCKKDKVYFLERR